VLVPGGRLSLFEPINRFGHPQPDHLFWGYDVTPVISLGRRVRAIYEGIQPSDDPMLDFDERDLLKMAEDAGFTEIHLEVRWDIIPDQHWSSGGWEAFIHLAPNPRVPTLQEAIREALTDEEIKRFIDHLRPLVENEAAQQRTSVAYLWAKKH
ncbi:MAG: chemotaxis protein CheR, partial [Chitinophagaceae bacterium]|nr:chemotaxis protein CheR [Anaerolineae bacterium]